MIWVKRGLVWSPTGDLGWAKTHATCPTPYILDSGVVRVYVQCRDAMGVGRIGFVDLDPTNLKKVLGWSKTPVLDVGRPGSFDDNGVFQTCVVKSDSGQLFMYYVGFELCTHIRYRLFTGLAISDDGGETFYRHSDVPILDRIQSEGFFRCGPFVLRTSDGYQMWYVSGDSWTVIQGKKMPVYDLKTIASKDGINWIGCGSKVLELNRDHEHGFGRPYVQPYLDGWQMFYSIRKNFLSGYRLGYAESSDLKIWNRKDESLGIDVSTNGWDCHSIEYAAPIKIQGKTWIFYNGNDFGCDGFGLAEMIGD